MTNNNNQVSVTYTDAELRDLVEEHIIQQKSEFTFKGVCSYILYRAMEEERTKGNGLYESDQLAPEDSERVRKILNKMVAERRMLSEIPDL